MSLLIIKSNNAVIDRVIVVHQRQPTEKYNNVEFFYGATYRQI